jgi:hypothetical protein
LHDTDLHLIAPMYFTLLVTLFNTNTTLTKSKYYKPRILTEPLLTLFNHHSANEENLLLFCISCNVYVALFLCANE